MEENNLTLNVNDFLNKLPIGICKFNADNNLTIEFINDTVSEILGFTKEQLSKILQGSFYNIVSEIDLQHFKGSINHNILNKSNPIDIEYRVKNNFNRILWFWQRVNVITNDDGTFSFLAVFYDVTLSRQSKELLEVYSRIDPLTRVFNKTAIESDINLIISGSEPELKQAFIMLDIDNFKKINDSQGHSQGDRILQKLSQIILTTVQESRTTGRLGGDEFVLYVAELDHDDYKARISKICNDIQRFANSLSFSVSMGIAVYPDYGTCFSELYVNADKALYHAKRLGKKGFCFYDG